MKIELGIQLQRHARAIVVLLALGLTSLTHGAPVTTDLWDSSRSGFTSPVIIGGGGSSCGGPALINVFGGSATCAQGAGTFVALGFDDLSIRWTTEIVTVGSFSLFSPSDFGGSSLNEIVGFRLFTLDSNNQNPVLFFDSGTISHNPPNNGSTPLISVTLTTPVTSANWRLDIIDQPSSEGAPIYQLIELDAFAPLETGNDVPEPSTVAFVAIGLASLHVLRRLRS